jgi:hypothetical protein
MKWLSNSTDIYQAFIDKIKMVLVLFPLVMISIQCYCQTDSILVKLISSSNSKRELIRKGRDQIVICLRKNNIREAKLIRDYLLSDVEDSLYVAFNSGIYPLVLYWMHDYEGLIDYFVHFDSLLVVNKNKIKPNDSGLYLELAWSLPEAAKFFFRSIEKSKLSREYKEVLILDLHKRAMEVDGGDYELKNYSARVKGFKKKYPNSRLKEYVEKHILHGNSWDKLE